MDNLRIFLWVGLLLMFWLVLQTWQQEQRVPAPAVAGDPSSPSVVDADPEDALLPGLPVGEPSAGAGSGDLPSAEAGLTQGTAVVRVHTDVLEAVIDLKGGTLSGATLTEYPVHKNQPDVPVELLNDSTDRFFVIQTGLRAAAGPPEPNHLATFTSAQTDYTLGAGQDELVVPLRWESGGIVVEKTYRFRRGRYDIALDHRVTNDTAGPYQAADYLQIQRRYYPPDRSMFDVDTYSFQGPAAYDGNKYAKLDVDDLRKAPFSQTVENGWLAALQHHFVTAAVPPPGVSWNYEGRFVDGRFVLSAIGPLQSVAPGQTAEFSNRLFVGPKLQAQLAETGKGLELTVDYGKLTILAKPLFWLLDKVHGFVGNWGWSIIIVTLLIKLVFYKLTETSGRSMARMRNLAPRMKALQERYKDDRQAMSQALMELYKREKVNPAAGCLPMLVQIPFFIAFYWVLLESVEMRQAPFMLWITDLSTRDPFFVLPLLMGAAMWFQQKLNPAPPDPMQAKIMQILPIVFTVFFAFFPAGLVLYWLTNSVLSILQQWRINKVLGA